MKRGRDEDLLAEYASLYRSLPPEEVPQPVDSAGTLRFLSLEADVSAARQELELARLAQKGVASASESYLAARYIADEAARRWERLEDVKRRIEESETAKLYFPDEKKRKQAVEKGLPLLANLPPARDSVFSPAPPTYAGVVWRPAVKE